MVVGEVVPAVAEDVVADAAVHTEGVAAVVVPTAVAAEVAAGAVAMVVDVVDLAAATEADAAGDHLTVAPPLPDRNHAAVLVVRCNTHAAFIFLPSFLVLLTRDATNRRFRDFSLFFFSLGSFAFC